MYARLVGPEFFFWVDVRRVDFVEVTWDMVAKWILLM